MMRTSLFRVTVIILLLVSILSGGAACGIVEISPGENKVTTSPTTIATTKPSVLSVRITSPSDLSTFIKGEKIKASVSAYDNLHGLHSAAYIQPYAKWVLDSGTPLSCTPLSSGDFEIDGTIPVGPHTITCSIEIKDEKGITTHTGSGSLYITIVQPTSPPTTATTKPSAPTVRITSPADGATFIEKEKITVSVTAVDYLGKPLSADYIKSNAKWVLDSGSSLSYTPLPDGDFEIDGTIPVGVHKIMVSIAVKDEKGLLTLIGTDYINITIAQQQLSPLETLLKKTWDMEMIYDDPKINPNNDHIMRFQEGGTFAYLNSSWKGTWSGDGSTVKMEFSLDYKSGPNMITRWEFTGTLIPAKDGDYNKAVLKGTFRQWNEWDKDKSLKTGTWTAD